jgi:peptide/nickel transport system substrate-binding protein
VGFGLAGRSDSRAGFQQVVTNLTRDTLIGFGSDGRPSPKMVESWRSSPDGLELKVWLKPALKFRDGAPMNAAVLSAILKTHLGEWLAPAADDVQEVLATSETELTFKLRRPSTFVIDALGQTLQGESPGATTGPFYVNSSTPDAVELRANPNYFAGKPSIERVIVRGYTSLRSAWADMLRNQVDLLYEVGVDALDLVKPSTTVNVYEHQRNYAHLVLFNVQKPALRQKELRQRLNEAINRDELVTDILDGHALAADTALWPYHWAYDPTAPKFQYAPRAIGSTNRPKVTCLFAERSLERLALAVQRQLQAVGLEVALELLPIEEWYARAQAGTFDILLADALVGPNVLRQYQFWHTGGPNNWGRYSNPSVDEALDRVRHAVRDDEYRAGVAAFQRAMIDDPPAIFLAWSRRARAVSAHFDVSVEPGRDVLSTVRLWRSAADKQMSHD